MRNINDLTEEEKKELENLQSVSVDPNLFIQPEVVKNIAPIIKQPSLPSITEKIKDEEIINENSLSTNPIKNEIKPVDDLEAKKAIVRDNLIKKYNLEDRQKLSDDLNKETEGFNWRAALAALGGGASAGQAMLDYQKGLRDSKLQDYDKKLKSQEEADIKERENDPNSIDSKLAQDLALQMGMNPNQIKGLTAARFKQFSPVLSEKYKIEENKIQNQLKREETRYAKDIAREEKQLVRDEKKKATLNEVEDRRTNIEDNITRLEDMIKDKGTYEVFGSHNVDMERLVDQIATDMAKLADPNSVARPSEVEMFKKGLIKPTATGMKNSTALNILKNFRGEINKRAENAYKIRGVENPGSQASKSNEQFKTINGVKYKKVQGGWEEV